jgi:undecaprenyl diphosphate synthase
MPHSDLRHIAVVANVLGPGRSGATAVLEAAEVAAAIAADAFAASPGLQAFSFLAPGVDRILGEPAAAELLRGCVEAARALEEAAARCGAALRLCGRAEGLPDALSRLAVHPPATASGRTLLWFLRYSGRDEIAKAAARFFRARPGATLGDDDLDAWLDTSGLPDPDLIVIVGGTFDVPDALVWQGSYAELWHSPKAWASFETSDLRRAIGAYTTRQRRFGG